MCRRRFQPNAADNANASAPFAPGILPFDLTRGGSLFNFHAAAHINEYAFYAQDAITMGNFQFHLGLRFDHYDGLVSKRPSRARSLCSTLPVWGKRTTRQ
jgi:outer membrane receptor protein involved in Fe transport